MMPTAVKLTLTIIALIAWGFLDANGQTRKTNADSLKISGKVVTADTTSTAQQPGDTLVQHKKKEPKPPYIHQLRFGIDIARIAFNVMYPSKQGYEIQADYKLRGKIYLAAEAGFGNGKVDYDNLKYSNNGYFARIGVDNSFLDIVGPSDFDMAFIGVRYGLGVGNRSEATYFVSSPFGPDVSGSVPAQNFVVHWGEITGGIKVECWKGLFAGWNMRGKFMLNSGVFKELSPNYIPGYGKGDKSVVFDFNFYISYALRWGKE